MRTDNLRQYIIYALLLAVIVWLFFSKSCGTGSTHSTTDTIRTQKVIHDTTTHSIQVSVPTPYMVVKEVHDTLKTNADTVRVIGDYFSKKFYKREFKDTSLSVTLLDTITENALAGQHFEYKIYRPTIIQTTTIIKTQAQHNKVSAGVFGTLTNNKIGLGLSGQFLSKSGKLITAGYDVINRSVMVGFGSVISFHKKME
jgi:hypothetical protein